jgi:EAL domain-containing protein (putative c-di-GMP-specific phosphodiesterase class I)
MRDWHGWPHLEVSVNLSPLQFRQSEIVPILERLASENSADPSKFVLEITEGVLMDAGERTRAALDRIRQMGFRMALDDFGTGYSSLAYLCNFHFDKIKIDRSFVSGLSHSVHFRTIVQSVIAIGSGLGMQIVAEGVEVEVEAQIVTELGCSEMQGYYFARPMPRAALLAFIEAYTPSQGPQTKRPLLAEAV